MVFSVCFARLGDHVPLQSWTRLCVAAHLHDLVVSSRELPTSLSPSRLVSAWSSGGGGGGGGGGGAKEGIPSYLKDSDSDYGLLGKGREVYGDGREGERGSGAGGEGGSGARNRHSKTVTGGSGALCHCPKGRGDDGMVGAAAAARGGGGEDTDRGGAKRFSSIDAPMANVRVPGGEGRVGMGWEGRVGHGGEPIV